MINNIILNKIKYGEICISFSELNTESEFDRIIKAIWPNGRISFFHNKYLITGKIGAASTSYPYCWVTQSTHLKTVTANDVLNILNLENEKSEMFPIY